MQNDTIHARDLLHNGHYTCVLCRNGNVLSDDRRGVKPLLELLDRDLTGFCAADKVVGKAAALLYQLLGIAELYAGVISEPAVQVLESHGITVFYDHRVPAIRNRTNTGFCPMETAVWNVDDPRLAPDILRDALAERNSTPGSL